MFATLPELYLSEPTACEDVLPTVRELLSQHPAVTHESPETFARLLRMLAYLPYQPETFEVEAALEALSIDGEIAA
jgi:hypothetical protein